MATILSTEKSQFINKVIETYTENRVGQYSKYLDTDPIFVTYYAINQAQSRADLGTDAVYSVLGENSPIRYNKIENFPLYFKGLDPQTNFEDGMASTEIELSDITFLPNTLFPKPFDHFVVQLPNMIPVLFRINSFKDITIQSNDFYSSEAHAIKFGKDVTAEIDKLVVETYSCVFENIGTQNSCFIESKNISKAEELKEMLNQMGDMYNAIYYNPDAGSYIFNESYYYSLARSTIFEDRPHPFHPYLHRYHAGMVPPWRAMIRCFPKLRPEFTTFYDIYLTKFMMDSGLFFNEKDVTTTSAVVYDDIPPVAMDFIYKKTLWYAVLTKNTMFLHKFPYYMNNKITKDYSVLNSFRFEDPRGFTLVMNVDEHVEDNGLGEYFSHQLLKDLKDGREKTTCTCDCDIKYDNLKDRSIINLEDVIDNPNKIHDNGISVGEYKVKFNEDNKDQELTEDEKRVLLFNDIIYNYINDIDQEINLKDLIKYISEPSLYCYEYFPIILYILKKKYENYFVSKLS